jgi:hypothetical protein
MKADAVKQPKRNRDAVMQGIAELGNSIRSNTSPEHTRVWALVQLDDFHASVLRPPFFAAVGGGWR